MTEPNPPSPDEPKPASASEESDPRQRSFGWVGFVVVAILVVGGWFLITTLSDETKMQDCIQSGRRNCAPIDTTGR